MAKKGMDIWEKWWYSWAIVEEGEEYMGKRLKALGNFGKVNSSFR